MKERIVAVDFGLRRLGLALSDETLSIASPWLVMEAKKKRQETINALIGLIKDKESELSFRCRAIVVGMPYMMSGKKGVMSDEVTEFIEHLALNGYPVIPFDERLTTKEADRTLKLFSLNRKKRSVVIDKVSASILLQCYLDLHLKRI